MSCRTFFSTQLIYSRNEEDEFSTCSLFFFCHADKHLIHRRFISPMKSFANVIVIMHK